MKIRNKKDIYTFLERDFFAGDINNLEIREIIEYFETRYCNELLNLEELNDIRFYNNTVKSINRLFDSIGLTRRKELAMNLIELLHNKYCEEELTEVRQWFYSAIIHTCFECLKESPEKFREVFCYFDDNSGEANLFCRFILVAKIENYSRFQCQVCRDFHKDVIAYDGEVVTKAKEDYKELLAKLWIQCYSFNEPVLGMVSCYNFLENYEKGKSIYWLIKDNNGGNI